MKTRLELAYTSWRSLALSLPDRPPNRSPKKVYRRHYASQRSSPNAVYTTHRPSLLYTGTIFAIVAADLGLTNSASASTTTTGVSPAASSTNVSIRPRTHALRPSTLVVSQRITT